MGKRIELTEVYRQPRPASSSGRTSDFGSEKARSNPGAGTKAGGYTKREWDKVKDQGQEAIASILAPKCGVKATKPKTILSEALEKAFEVLEHKRAIKAASMRRYRAKKKTKP